MKNQNRVTSTFTGASHDTGKLAESEQYQSFTVMVVGGKAAATAAVYVSPNGSDWCVVPQAILDVGAVPAGGNLAFSFTIEAPVPGGVKIILSGNDVGTASTITVAMFNNAQYINRLSST